MTSSVAAKDTNTYNNSEHGISIEYPPDWIFEENIDFQKDNSNNGNKIVTFMRSNIMWAKDVAALIIFTMNLPVEQTTLKSYNGAYDIILDIFIKNLKQIPSGFELIEESPIFIARKEDSAVDNNDNSIIHSIINNDNYHRILSCKTIVFYNSKRTIKTMAVYIISDNCKAYMLYYTGEIEPYPKYLPTAQKMIGSFRITKNKDNDQNKKS